MIMRKVMIKKIINVNIIDASPQLWDQREVWADDGDRTSSQGADHSLRSCHHSVWGVVLCLNFLIIIVWSSLSGHHCLVIIIIVVWSSPWSSQVGDLLELNCTSEPSHPPSQLRWEINKEEVRQTISNLQTVEFYFNWYQIICLPGILFMFAEDENLLFFV